MVQGTDVRLVSDGRVVTVHDVPADLSVLDWLREREHRTGTKEGCREGDCGACTVVVATPTADDSGLRFRPVDSCITLLRSIDGCALWTVEDLAAPDGSLHPVQQAIVDHHASQCGFCTPGIVMSLFALYQQRLAGGDARPVTREEASDALAGNLCRCTGYRSVLEAATEMTSYPPRRVDEASTVAMLTAIRPHTSLESVLHARRDNPAAVVVAGGTDVGVWLNDGVVDLADIICLHGVPELESIVDEGDRVVVGAAAALDDAWEALCRRRPGLAAYASRFAGPQVRAMGTFGGNLVTASPIGDTTPVLIALGADLRLASVDRRRSLPVEDFFLGYRRTALGPDEIVVAVEVPNPVEGEAVAAFKHSRRHDDDIATVSLAVRVVVRDGDVADVRIGAGGVAATPVRARATEEAMRGATWSAATVSAAAEVLHDEFSPIDDVRATALNRRDELAALMRQVWPGGTR